MKGKWGSVLVNEREVGSLMLVNEREVGSLVLVKEGIQSLSVPKKGGSRYNRGRGTNILVLQVTEILETGRCWCS